MDSVVYFAALSLVGESMADPQKYYINNVSGTYCYELYWIVVQKMAFLSTAAVYDEPENVPIDEDSRMNPIW